MTINGVTFKSPRHQAIASGQVSNSAYAPVYSQVNAGASNFTISWISGAPIQEMSASGDVELDSKPTWSY
jgi:hypothetical protein